jgi:hypothetical protein
MTSRARIGAQVLSLALVLAAMVLLAGTAEASCAATPQPSAHSFTGTVLSVEHNGVTATVRTDRGREVTVVGGPNPSDDGGSTADRRYAVGARYEFHPINSASPFHDNACTATRKLSGPEPPPLSGADDRLPGWLPVDEDAGLVGYSILGLLALGGVALAAKGAAATRRTWSGRGGSTAFPRED